MLGLHKRCRTASISQITGEQSYSNSIRKKPIRERNGPLGNQLDDPLKIKGRLLPLGHPKGEASFHNFQAGESQIRLQYTVGPVGNPCVTLGEKRHLTGLGQEFKNRDGVVEAQAFQIGPSLSQQGIRFLHHLAQIFLSVAFPNGKFESQVQSPLGTHPVENLIGFLEPVEKEKSLQF